MKLIVSSSPHITSQETTQSIMMKVIIATVPAMLASLLFFGIGSIIRIAVSVAACMFFEYAWEKAMKKPVTVSDLSAAVTGVLLAFNVPSTLPVWQLVVGALVSIIVVKQLFGGIGLNFANPAIVGRIVLSISYAGAMTNFTLDGAATATPLAVYNNGAGTMPALMDMFIGKTGGVLGETSAICLILGGIYLLARKVISWRIPVSYVASFAVLIFLFAPGHQFDVIYLLEEICGGGLLLGAIFMATDYVTSPITPNGKLVFGVCLGLLTFIFRMFGGSAEGVSYAIIFCNLLVPLIEMVTVPKSFGKKKPEKKEKEAAK